MKLDYSLFPDIAELPDALEEARDKADYLARVCGAWDFGLPMTRDTFALLATWRSIFDTFPIPNSPAYVALRMMYGWPPRDGGRLQTAHYERLDARDRELPDPYVDCT